MQVKKNSVNDNEVKVSVIANESELQSIKSHVLGHFQSRVKVPGFRAGKVPSSMLEKHVDQQALQTQFLEEAVEQLYVSAVNEAGVRPVAPPKIEIKKFVPFTTLEFECEVSVVGEVKLPDYKKIRKTAPTVNITDKDVDEVLNSLKTRMAEKKDVSRAAQDGDQVWIDFYGTDSKGEPVKGADGKDYPLVLGSKTFIPGFEENLVGLKAGDENTFTLKFPKDYSIKAMANKAVTFKVTVTKAQEVVDPKIDNEFAAKAGPFKTVKELKDDIQRQLVQERSQQAQSDFEMEIVREIAGKSKLSVPGVLVDEEVERMMRDLQQNLAYRGQTFPELLEVEGKNEEQYRKEVVRPKAEERVKISLVLSEIAEAEKIEVTNEELDMRMQTLKTQYTDPSMQAELNKPNARRDIASRIMTEKTIGKLVEYTQK